MSTPRTPAPLVILALALVSCEAPPDPLELGPATAPVVFAPGAVSTEAREYGITFTPDGTEAYFTRRGRRGPPRIFVSRWANGAWSRAEPASFAGEGDETPFVGPDGSTLWFSSRRPLPGSGDRSNNLWTVTRSAEGWGPPAPVPGEVNRIGREHEDDRTGDERGPLLLPGGALLFWTDSDPDWGADLYVAEPEADGTFGRPRPLRINSSGDESSPAMSPDGRYLVFQGYREAAGVGEQDLYVSERTEIGWARPRLLPEPINSRRNDGYPSFGPGGRYFFFASDRAAGGGYYSIYAVAVEALGLEGPPDSSVTTSGSGS